MADPVDLPVAGPDAGLSEIFEVIAVRLETVAKVLEVEHKWFGDMVEWNRTIEGGEEAIARALADGWMDEEAAEEKRNNDELLVPKANVDKHQQNIHSAVHILKDASNTLRALVKFGGGDASCD